MNQVAAQSGKGQALFNLDTCSFSNCHKIWVPLTKEVLRVGKGGVFESFLPGVACSFQVFVKVVSSCVVGVKGVRGGQCISFTSVIVTKQKHSNLRLKILYREEMTLTQKKQVRQLQDRTDFQGDRTDFFNFEIISKGHIAKSNGQK